jgi:ATP-dependent Lhr-like helicase
MCSRSRSRGSARREYGEDELFAFVRRAWPYRSLSRGDFDAVVGDAGEGFATRRGRRAGARASRRSARGLKGRRGTRMLALTSGRRDPEVADYRSCSSRRHVRRHAERGLRDREQRGRHLQLGNASWQITQVVARQRARQGCARGAADDPVLARRGAGAK